ncbi:MAG: NAD+ synthase [Rhodanobacteraceae bacterium]
MSVLRFAMAQFDFPVGAVAANTARMAQLAGEARAAGCALVVFPELALSGYPPEDLLLRPAFLDACDDALNTLAQATGAIAVCVGHPHRDAGLCNALSVLRDGRVELTHCKRALPDYGVFDEQRYFKSGRDSAVVEIDGVRVGLLICEDVWTEEAARAAVAAGADLLLVINASPFDIRQGARREEVLVRHARDNDVSIAYLNAVGGQDDLLFDGASLLVESDGRIAARADAFADLLLIAQYDARTRRFRTDWAHTVDSISASAPDATIYAGLVRGIRDYVRKNGFSGVLLGLSGGVDSGLTLALAVDALGADHVDAVMLPSRHTSELSLREAEAQARVLGVAYQTFSIEQAFEAFSAILAPAFAGLAADTTEENLQARCRGVILMALSNKFGRLLLATGNKSELAVGYATLYGDMCGAYAPLKDVYKTVVYRLARWRNGSAAASAHARDWVIPQAVIERAPSAELRAGQTDQDSLPPYDVLDAILERFIEDAQSPDAIIAAGYDEAIVRRVARLVYANEYKRRQAPPGPKITTCAFGRERRYPISSGWRG